MNNRMKKPALSVVANTPDGFINGISLFIYNVKPFFGVEILHNTGAKVAKFL